MQVGSKNAAFYLGQSVKMCTKTQEGRYVHQLSLAAAELEARYKKGEVNSASVLVQPACRIWLLQAPAKPPV